MPALHYSVLGATLFELFLKQYERVVCPGPALLSDGPISVHYRFVAFLLISYIPLQRLYLLLLQVLLLYRLVPLCRLLVPSLSRADLLIRPQYHLFLDSSLSFFDLLKHHLTFLNFLDVPMLALCGAPSGHLQFLPMFDLPLPKKASSLLLPQSFTLLASLYLS